MTTLYYCRVCVSIAVVEAYRLDRYDNSSANAYSRPGSSWRSLSFG